MWVVEKVNGLIQFHKQQIVPCCM